MEEATETPLRNATRTARQTLQEGKKRVQDAKDSTVEGLERGYDAANERLIDLAEAASRQATEVAELTRETGDAAGRRVERLGVQFDDVAGRLRDRNGLRLRERLEDSLRTRRGTLGAMLGLAIGLILGRMVR